MNKKTCVPFAAALLLACGCATNPGPDIGPEPAPATNVVSGVAVPAVSLVVNSLSIEAASVDGTRPEFARALGRKLGDECEMRGFARPTDGADALVRVSASRKEEAKLANWRVFSGDADVSVVDSTGKTIAFKTFHVDPQERGLGDDRAEEPVVSGLASAIAEWLSGKLPRKAQD